MNGKRIGWVLLLMGLVSLMLANGLWAQATRAFVSRYDGSGHRDDEARDLKIDDDGNVYVTGRSAGDGSGMDYVTIKYGPDGRERWVRCYNGPANGEDAARALAIDAQGNVYVTGESLGTVGGMDYATIKYDKDGNELWVRRYDGPDHLQDHAIAIAVDSQGRVYVTGASKGEATELDIATVAYDSDGKQLWVQRYDGADHDDDYPVGIAVDHNDNIFVAGTRDDDDSKYDYVTIKYAPDGREQWVRIYDGPDEDDDIPWAITTDAAGNCYVTGQSTGLSTNYDYATVKYAPDGTEQWVTRYNSNGQRNEDNTGRAIAVDADGFVYVTGSSVENGLSDYATVKYAPDGTEVWSQMYRGPGVGINIATAIALDLNGSVYITGRSVGERSGLDYVTIKYDAHGVQQWIDRYNGPGNAADAANALALDAAGNVYVTGSSVGEGTGMDYATIKYLQP